MDVSKNRGGPPKWMVYNGKPYEKMDDLEEKPTILGNTYIDIQYPIQFNNLILLSQTHLSEGMELVPEISSGIDEAPEI